MDSNIIAGIIGASATLIGAFISSPYIIKFFLNKEKSKIYIQNPSRIKWIKGGWSGQTIQDMGISGTNMPVDLNISFDITDNLIVGKAKVSWKENTVDKSIHVDCEGGFVSENFVRVLYQYHSTEIQNYGVMFLELDAGGDILKGNMVGYGHRSKSIVKGTTYLRKTT